MHDLPESVFRIRDQLQSESERLGLERMHKGGQAHLSFLFRAC